jgi:hypothetical protein
MDPEWKRYTAQPSRSVWSNWSINVYGEVAHCNGKISTNKRRSREMLDKLVERYLSNGC